MRQLITCIAVANPCKKSMVGALWKQQNAGTWNVWKNINNWNGICYSLWTLLPSTIAIKWKWKKIVTVRSHTHTIDIYLMKSCHHCNDIFTHIYFRFPRIVTIQLVRDRVNLCGSIRILRWLKNVCCGAFVTFVWFTHNTSQVCLAEMGKKSILVSRLYLAQWTKFMQCHEPTLACLKYEDS